MQGMALSAECWAHGEVKSWSRAAKLGVQKPSASSWLGLQDLERVGNVRPQDPIKHPHLGHRHGPGRWGGWVPPHASGSRTLVPSGHHCFSSKAWVLLQPRSLPGSDFGFCRLLQRSEPTDLHPRPLLPPWLSFETESHSCTQTGLELATLLPQPPRVCHHS